MQAADKGTLDKALQVVTRCGQKRKRCCLPKIKFCASVCYTTRVSCDMHACRVAEPKDVA